MPENSSFATDALKRSNRVVVIGRCLFTATNSQVAAVNSQFAVKAHTLAPEHLLGRKRERSRAEIAPSGVPMGFHVGDWVVRHGILEPQREADFERRKAERKAKQAAASSPERSSQLPSPAEEWRPPRSNPPP